MPQESLFEIPDEPRARLTRAPDHLNELQIKRLRSWAERTVPWISRSALGSLLPLETRAEEALEYFRGAGKRKADWTATIQTWIRRDELPRVEQMARRGNDSAAEALRDPAGWASSFDRLTSLKPKQTEEYEMIRPSGARSMTLSAKP